MSSLLVRFFALLSVLSFSIPAFAQVASPDELSTLPGFEVELIYTVPKETEGSWVALAKLRDGRLVASDQGKKGLFIIDVGTGADVTVSKIPVEASAAQGIADTEDGLYVNIHNRGMSLLKDTNGDGQYDTVEKLEQYAGGGEHGQHALVLDKDGESLWVESGNHTLLPSYKGVRTGGSWGEDLLLPRQWDARGHATEKYAPGGWITQFNLKTREHTVHSIGYRNSYDLDQNDAGDLFTFDADMEWDMGMPWYRPTRICHAVSGSEFGWRSGTGKWPDYFEDSLPPVVDIGPASPTGVVFGRGAEFPAKYQRALYALDWTFGIIYAIHMKPVGASYQGEAEIFASGVLPVTDAVVGNDGMLYFTTGGRGGESALYRIRYTGDESVENVGPAAISEEVAAARQIRGQLEAFHGVEDPGAVDAALPQMGSEDRFIRFAARLAIESQPVASWRDRVLSGSPAAAINGAIALARCGEPSDQPAVLSKLDGLLETVAGDDDLCLRILRAYQLAFIRLGSPADDYRKQLSGKLQTWMPSANDDVNNEVIRVLVYLRDPVVIEKTLELIRNRKLPQPSAWADIARRNKRYGDPIQEMLANPPASQEIGYAFMLRNLRGGWTMDQRRDYLKFLLQAGGGRGGASFNGFLSNLRDEFLGNCTNEELEQLSEFAEVSFHAEPDFEIRKIAGPGREWTVEGAQAFVGRNKLKQADFENGRSLFHAASCANCHRFAGYGGDIGPDLTSVKNKFSMNYFLQATIHPDRDISDQYSAMKIQLEDGDLITGLVVPGKDGQMKIYPSSDDGSIKEIVVSKDEIAGIAPSETSQMPSGLLNSLSETEVRDLAAYIMSGGDPKSRVYK